MKQFLRIESWLLIIPFLLLLIEKFLFSNSALDFHLHDTYFVISGFHFGIVILLFCWILYLCHFSLRARKSGNKKILAAHVNATLLLLIFFFIFNFIVPGWTNAPMKPRQYYDYSSWQSFYQYDGTSIFFTVLILAFIVIQLLFILYTIIRLIF